MTKEERIQYHRNYRKNNPDKFKAYRNNLSDEDKALRKSYDKEYRIKNAERIKLKKKDYRQKNLEQIRKRDKVYNKARSQTDEHKEYMSNYKRNRYKNDIQYRLTELLRKRFYKAFVRGWKKGSAVSDLGCSIHDFKKYIETQFKDGMSWDNQGEWHLDHIIPLSAFDLTQKEQVAIALHYTNYQPLWKVDNECKNDLTVLNYTEGFF